jgi:hypothetical protein
LQFLFVTNEHLARSAASHRLITAKVFASEICGDQIVRAPAATDVNLRSRGAYHITVAIERVQETGLVAAGIWLNSPQRALVYEECRFQRAVVPPEPHGSPGLVICAAMIWKLNHRLPPIGLSADEPRIGVHTTSLEACSTASGRAHRSDVRLVNVIDKIWRG